MTLERNRLVGIFLQRLEHFQGIMILTTNRIDDIDPAVLDRLLLKIPYHPLSPSARRDVLGSLLQSVQIVVGESTRGFDEAFLGQFASMRVDGRQVSHGFVGFNAV